MCVTYLLFSNGITRIYVISDMLSEVVAKYIPLSVPYVPDQAWEFQKIFVTFMSFLATCWRRLTNVTQAFDLFQMQTL